MTDHVERQRRRHLEPVAHVLACPGSGEPAIRAAGRPACELGRVSGRDRGRTG